MINYGAMFSAKPQFTRPYSAAYTKRRTNAEWYISPLYFPPLARGAWFRIAPLARKRCSEILPLNVNRVQSQLYLYIHKRRENFYLLRYWRSLRLLALNFRNIPFWRRRIRQPRPDNAASRLFRLSARPWRNKNPQYSRRLSFDEESATGKSEENYTTTSALLQSYFSADIWHYPADCRCASSPYLYSYTLRESTPMYGRLRYLPA